jgi:hypothetical protein
MADAPRRALPAISVAHLWALLALAVVGAFIALVPTAPHDFWWHLKAGQLTASHGIPAGNMFAWTLPADAPFIYQSWLAEWLFYALYRLGGLPLAIFARNALGLAAFALVAYNARLRSGSWRVAAGCVLLAGAMTLNNLTARPQNWSWPLAALLALLLSRYAAGGLRSAWLWAIPPLLALWANVHGAFVIGLLLLGSYAVGETLRALLRSPGALRGAELRKLYLVAVVSCAAVLLNPQGAGIFGYVGALLGNATVQELISEWQPPTPRSLAGGAFFLGVLAMLAAFAFARRRPSISDVLLVCGLCWMGFTSARHVVWFALVALPVAVGCLASARAADGGPQMADGGSATHSDASSGRRSAVVAGWLMALVLALPVLLVQPWIKPALPLPASYQSLFAPVPGGLQLFSSDTPVAAAAHLREQACAGRLFNEQGAGSYLIWANEGQQIFIDPRIELFPDALWQEYVAISQGRDLEALLVAKYDVRCVLLDRPLQPRLAAALAADPQWERSFPPPGAATGERAEVWRRK